ncbi:MAG: hypothetical protein SchgKO_24560 [Schleiferiaceae bacterium]
MELNQITLPTTQMEASAAFYQLLGCILIVDSIPRYSRFKAPVGNTTFSLHRSETPPQQPGMVLYFECENLEEQVELLESKGIVFNEPITDKDWGWTEATTQDPDGHQIILYRAGEYRLNPPWKVTAP